MATVRLRGHVSEEGDLPDVCMKCGAPAAVYKNKTFSWLPGWVYVLLLAGVLVFVIVALILTKRRRVCVPLCEKHKNHWLMRQVVLLVSFLALVVLGFVAMLFFADSRPGSAEATIGGALCVGTVVGLVGWVILVAVFHVTSIRVVEITERAVKLQGVSRRFVDAYEDLLDRDAEWLDRAARERWERRRRPRADEPEGRGRYRRRGEDEDEDGPPRRGSDRYRPRD
jgi:hypothetical protein